MSTIVDRLHPFSSRILERAPLTKNSSTKQTYHIALDLKDSGITFKTGDSIAISPQNDPVLVEEVLKAMQAHGDETIQDPRGDQTLILRHFVTHKANLSRITLHDLRELAHNKTPLQEICSQFGPLLPRFYSIASSIKTHPDEVHLAVALFTLLSAGEMRYGVASHFLCHLAELGTTPVPLYVHPSRGFTLPADPHAPMIMVGPGTGIAPFRAFLQERLHDDAPGKNWLFFGERNRSSDFFYEDLWHSYTLQGKLKLNTAFSRDQEDKVYVQHKMYEEKADIWKWLEEGAYFYVCGDAHKMAKDVDAMLQLIAREEGSLSEEAAKAYVKNLRAQKRYLLDVY